MLVLKPYLLTLLLTKREPRSLITALILLTGLASILS